MSRIVWKKAKRPLSSEASKPHVYDLYDNFDFRIPRTIALPLLDEEIVVLPEPRTFRALNRCGLLLTAVGLQSRDALAVFLAEDPLSVGLYCAMQDGPDDFNTAKQMAYSTQEEFARRYKFLRSSKFFLRESGSIQSSVLGMFLGIMGPLYGFTHSRWACLQALEQAEFDLQSGVVQAALVGASFSLEDPLLSMRTRRNIPESSDLCEGAAVMVLAANGLYTNWRNVIPVDEQRFYGTAHDLVLLAAENEEDGEDHDRFPVSRGDEESHGHLAETVVNAVSGK
ncbi:MAG TPA: hypothetical protein VKY85_11925 [Candidatus Angelobacter sp.]|nr:hypothetical protein [Candidatus Angelobacter sp.]